MYPILTTRSPVSRFPSGGSRSSRPRCSTGETVTMADTVVADQRRLSGADAAV